METENLAFGDASLLPSLVLTLFLNDILFVGHFSKEHIGHVRETTFDISLLITWFDLTALSHPWLFHMVFPSQHIAPRWPLHYLLDAEPLP